MEGDDPEKKLRAILKHFQLLIDDGASKARLFAPRGKLLVKLPPTSLASQQSQSGSLVTAASSEILAATLGAAQHTSAAEDKICVTETFSHNQTLDLCCSDADSSDSEGSGCEHPTQPPAKRRKGPNTAQRTQSQPTLMSVQPVPLTDLQPGPTTSALAAVKSEAPTAKSETRTVQSEAPAVKSEAPSVSLETPTVKSETLHPREFAPVGFSVPSQAAATASQPTPATSKERQLMGILQGSGISLVEARALIARGGGEVGRAVAMFYDGENPTPAPTQAAPAATLSKPGKATVSRAKAAGVKATRLSSKATVGQGVLTSASQDTPSQDGARHGTGRTSESAAKQASQTSVPVAGKKGAAGSAAVASGKQRGVATVVDPAQRSIMSFFMKPSSSGKALSGQPAVFPPQASKSMTAGSQGLSGAATPTASVTTAVESQDGYMSILSPPVSMQDHKAPMPQVSKLAVDLEPGLDLDLDLDVDTPLPAATAITSETGQQGQLQLPKPKLSLPKFSPRVPTNVAGRRRSHDPQSTQPTNTSTLSTVLPLTSTPSSSSPPAETVACPGDTQQEFTGATAESRQGRTTVSTVDTATDMDTDVWDFGLATASVPESNRTEQPPAVATPHAVSPELELMGRVLRMNAAAEAAEADGRVKHETNSRGQLGGKGVTG